MATSPVKEFLVAHFMPEKCYEEFFVKYHFHVPCLKFVLNRTAGIWILLDTLLAQLPQLLKILWRGSAEGLSLTSVLLQLYAFSCPVVYAMAKSFPLFAWAERLFGLVQTAAIVFLILRCRGDTVKGLLFLLAYSGIMFLLGSYAAVTIVSVMQDSSLAALVASKGLQARTNHCNGHTGQLSTVSVLLSWAGSLGVAFASLQDPEISFTALSHILSVCLSCVLLGQVLCYRSYIAGTTKKNE